jgi:hypothetical protein
MGITQQIGASSLIKPGVIDNTAARPASPFEGQVIFQKDTDQLLVWDGTAWVIPNSPAQNPTGLEFISKTVITSGGTFSNAFSSTYDHYKIIADVTCSTNAQGIYFRGQGSTGSTHQGNTLYADNTTTVVSNEQMSTYTTYAYIVGYTSAVRLNMEIDFYNPFSATIPTRVKSTFVGDRYSGSSFGRDTFAASSTAFYFTPVSGDFTSGTITLYGYKKG